MTNFTYHGLNIEKPGLLIKAGTNEKTNFTWITTA